MSTPVQVDPPGCGCTECLTGEYVPLDMATADQVRRMIDGELNDATDAWITVKGEYPRKRIAFTRAYDPDRDLVWEW